LIPKTTKKKNDIFVVMKLAQKLANYHRSTTASPSIPSSHSSSHHSDHPIIPEPLLQPESDKENSLTIVAKFVKKMSKTPTKDEKGGLYEIMTRRR